jgi:hypothetical protein
MLIVSKLEGLSKGKNDGWMDTVPTEGIVYDPSLPCVLEAALVGCKGKSSVGSTDIVGTKDCTSDEGSNDRMLIVGKLEEPSEGTEDV